MNIPSHGKYKWLPLLYNFINQLKPKKVIELGPATGYTTITMAQSLKDNIGNTPPIYGGHINSYDIWDDRYWGTQENCQKEINEWGVQEFVTLKHLDFYDWLKTEEEFDFLYFDIDNNGEKLLTLYEHTKEQIENGSVIIFEGGSVERDKYVTSGLKSMNGVKDIVGYDVLTENIKYSVSGIWSDTKYAKVYETHIPKPGR